MTSPRKSMEAVARAIATSGKLPPEMSVMLQEADQQSDDADVDLPLIEIQPDTIEEIVIHNTDFVGYVTDSNGNQVGRKYQSDYEMMIDIRLWTIEDDSYDVDNLVKLLREALYPYSSYGPDKPFTDENKNEIGGIDYFRIDDSERVDDLFSTPTVRKWSQMVELWGCEQFRTTEDYITSVNYPDSGDFNDSDGNGTIDNI